MMREGLAQIKRTTSFYWVWIGEVGNRPRAASEKGTACAEAGGSFRGEAMAGGGGKWSKQQAPSRQEGCLTTTPTHVQYCPQFMDSEGDSTCGLRGGRRSLALGLGHSAFLPTHVPKGDATWVWAGRRGYHVPRVEKQPELLAGNSGHRGQGPAGGPSQGPSACR